MYVLVYTYNVKASFVDFSVFRKKHAMLCDFIQHFFEQALRFIKKKEPQGCLLAIGPKNYYIQRLVMILIYC